MRTLLAAAILLFLVFAVPSAAWAGGRDRHRGHGHQHRHRHEPPPDLGPDLDGDGRVTNYKRIQYTRKQRFERLHGD